MREGTPRAARGADGRGRQCRPFPSRPGGATLAMRRHEEPRVPEHVNDFCRPYVEETGLYRTLHFEPSEFQSRMSKREPVRLVLDYTRTMMGFLLFRARPE